MSGPAIPDPNDPAILSAARLVPDQPAPLPTQPVRRPLVETAPGDHRLAKIGYVLARIETDPITGLDTIWYWQRSDPPVNGEC